MFIENYEADISEDISTLLTFELDDIKDFSSRSTTWSKTIVLPGTSRNNKLFGHIFQIGQANTFNDSLDNINYNYNAAKAARVIIFQDQLQTFKGVLRLTQINLTKGKIEYEVAVFGEMHGLNVALSSRLLEDLDFSAYDHVWDHLSIIASWDNVPGSGYYYPLIDYGTYSFAKHDWDIRTFRPALYVKEYLDKMFEAADYRYTSAITETDRFKRLVIPHNQKKLYSSAENYIYANVSGTQILTPVSPSTKVDFPDVVDNNGFTITGDDTFNYDNASTINPTISVSLSGTVSGTLQVGIYRQRGVDPEELLTSVPISGTINTPFSVNLSVQAEVQQNDDIYVKITGFSIPAGQNIVITSGSIRISPGGGLAVELSIGDTVNINSTIPKNVRQIDFLVSIVKLFNLYVYESLNDSRLIYITPYVDFYSTDSTDSVDWTYKLNRDKPIKVKPMSELNAKIYDFKYKPDSDFYNEAYRKRYGQGYGDYIFDSQFEFSEQKSSLELVFSATPLVGYAGEEKVYPTIFKRSGPGDDPSDEENIDSNIRILLTKKLAVGDNWDIMDGISSLASSGDYPYAGHFDDPDAPSNDLNFGALRELFFELVSGDLTVTQFNVYWSAYMAEITDKDSKLVTAYFKLDPVDIINLDFSKKVFIDGILYRLNKIKDYNVSMPGDCEIELLKVNYLIY